MKKQDITKQARIAPRRLLSQVTALALLAESGGSVLAAEAVTLKPEESLK